MQALLLMQLLQKHVLQLYDSTKHILVHQKIIHLMHTMGFMIKISIISGVHY